MSPDGEILFHDINEFQSSFGIWGLWSELVEEFPGQTMQFGHSHGLGVMSLAKAPAGPLSHLISWVNSDTQNQHVLQQFDLQIGEIASTRKAESSLHNEERGSLGHLLTSTQEENSALRRQIGNLSDELEDLRATLERLQSNTSWKAGYVLRSAGSLWRRIFSSGRKEPPISAGIVQ